LSCLPRHSQRTAVPTRQVQTRPRNNQRKRQLPEKTMPDSFPSQRARSGSSAIQFNSIRSRVNRNCSALVRVICSGLIVVAAGGCDNAPGQSLTEVDLVLPEQEIEKTERLIVRHETDERSASRRTEERPQNIPEWMLPYYDAISGDRNPAHGKAIFARACKNCHRLEDDGYEVGADLSLIGPKSDVQIMIDILEPSREIKPQFKAWTVVTKDGFVSSGLLASETKDSVTLKKENGLTHLIFRRDIEEMAESHVSLMPGNLREQLQPTELAHLIGYLRRANRAVR